MYRDPPGQGIGQTWATSIVFEKRVMSCSATAGEGLFEEDDGLREIASTEDQLAEPDW